MQLIDGMPVYSATDLVGYLACGHLSELERSVLAGLVKKPIRNDPELDLVAERGKEHERVYVERLRAAGREIVDVSAERAKDADRGDFYRGLAAATRAAIERGDDVIFQACFFDGTWLGFADFLLRIDDQEAPLGWSYEVADTKLAHKVKASALLQICVYNEMLSAIQGRYPEHMYVALGGKDRETARYRTADFRAYFRSVRARFLDAVGAPLPVAYPPPLPSYPEPTEHCALCRWDEICSKRRRADDHLSLVANITSRTRGALVERDIGTRRALAGLPLPLEPRLEGTRPEALEHVREQARIQVQGEDEGRPIHELLEPHRTQDGELDTTKGLLALPEPRPGDLYLDLEGDPFAGEDGIDYLFGLLQPSEFDANGDPRFHAFWSRDVQGRVTEAAEKAAFEATIDKIMACLEADPSLHVYHYAPYEPTHLGKLMGRYNTRQDEVDRLFRGDVLVDLYQVVRQGLRASVESYSIKRLEPFYGFRREIELRDAGSSIVEFEHWLQLGGVGGVGEEILDQITAYNRDDVVSTLELHRWLEAQRAALAAQQGRELPRPQVRDGEAGEGLTAWLERVNEVAEPLVEGIPADETEREWTPQERGRMLLADLLGWHRREQKPDWWRYFSQLEMTTDELIDAREPLGGLQLVGVENEAKRTYRYRFPEQDFDVGTSATDPATMKNLAVVKTDPDAHEIVLRFPRKCDIAHPRALVAKTVVPSPAQEQRLLDIGLSVVDSGNEIDVDGPYRAARDLLLGRTPRIVGHRDGEPLRLEGESAGDAARRLVKQLDRTCLAIQGPPGSGKTWIGGRMILELVAQGKTVGVTAGSHKVIGNLLDNVWSAQGEFEAFRRREVVLRQKPGDSGECTCEHAAPIRDAANVTTALGEGSADVIGGTAWLWASDKIPTEAVDVLFIDEAGQFSLANALAVSAAAKSIVLLGDPQQLDQPLKGSHPIGAERSALAHLLGRDTAVMPARLGLFMDKTWRLHPDICSYTSEVFYASALLPESGNERQALSGPGLADGQGIRYIAVDHADARNDNRSVEEARVIAELVCELLDGRATWVNRDLKTATMGPKDILVITPYNAQRTLIRTVLRQRGGACAQVEVGTVDKFQGQQAPVSIYSMATSRPEDAPRGMEFLYSLNRLNVATSRARCLTLVVASPELIRAQARSPRQMVLANALCRLHEVAAEQMG
jgi:predicted RecB family nuclease